MTYDSNDTKNSPQPEPSPLKLDVLGRVMTPPAERERFLDLFEASNLNGAEFARRHGLRYQTFASWRQSRNQQRANEQGRSSAREAQKATPLGLAEVVLETTALEPAAVAAPENARDLIIELKGGHRLKLHDKAAIPMAAALLKALDQEAADA